MSKVNIINLEKDEGCEVTVKIEINFVYSTEESSVVDIKKELELIIEKHSI